MIQELKNKNNKIFKVFTPQFKYDDYGQKVTDSEGNIALDVRGWGLFCNLKNGDRLQDDFGKWVTDTLNKAIAIAIERGDV